MEIRQHGHRRASQSPPPPRWQAATRQRGGATRPGERLFGLRTTRADVSATVVRLSPTRTRGRRAAGAAPSGASLLPTWQRRPPSDRLSQLVGARALTRRPSPPTMAPSWSRRGHRRRGARPPPLPPLAARRKRATARRRVGRTGGAGALGWCLRATRTGGWERAHPPRRLWRRRVAPRRTGRGRLEPSRGRGSPPLTRRAALVVRRFGGGAGAVGARPPACARPHSPRCCCFGPCAPQRGLRPRAARCNAQRRDGVI